MACQETAYQDCCSPALSHARPPQAPGLEHFPVGRHIDHASQAKIGINPFPDKLHVVTMLSNPLRWRSRYSNYWLFEKRVRDAGALLYTAEVAFGDRAFEVTDPYNPQHLQLRTQHELWHKENAMNLMIQRLPADAQYIAWIDADITFQRSDWAQETLHRLQHYDFLQMFSMAHDLNIDNEITTTHSGFMFEYMQSSLSPTLTAMTSGVLGKTSTATDIAVAQLAASYGSGLSGYWHPGFAWAARKSALNHVGGLIDFAILGSADWHMAWSLIGRGAISLAEGLSPVYRSWVNEWEARAEQHIKRNVGFMPGSIFHSFHGQKAQRYYGERWKFLINAGFDPSKDIKKDHQGLWQLSDNKQMLRDGIRQYGRIRNEDEQ